MVELVDDVAGERHQEPKDKPEVVTDLGARLGSTASHPRREESLGDAFRSFNHPSERARANSTASKGGS